MKITAFTITLCSLMVCITASIGCKNKAAESIAAAASEPTSQELASIAPPVQEPLTQTTPPVQTAQPIAPPSMEPAQSSAGPPVALVSQKTQISPVQIADPAASMPPPISSQRSVPPLRVLGPDEDLLAIVEDAPGVVLLDFYASWCGPCKKQAVVLHEVEDIARSVGAQMIKVDVEQHKDIANQLSVRSLPTLIVLKNQQIIEKKLGLTDRDKIVEFLNR